MLTREDNELLARVGPGTAGGAVFRQYWLPAFPSTDLGGADSDPVRIRLLGEDLIAFRDSSGRVGIVANNCPHRGASLFFGRNEEDGLRCVYHGWKFDVSGACVDMPNEPAESDFKVKVRAVAYPTLEQGGVVFVYMGPEANPPALPRLEWTLVPLDQRYLSMRWEYCNWAQALEGGIDSSHSSFLHSRLNPEDYTGSQRRGLIYKTRDTHPRFEVVDTDYGVLVGARRDAEEDSYYWRITQFLMPFYQMIPPYGESPTLSGHAWVPIDDENVMTWSVTWHPTRPLTSREVDQMQTYPTSGIHVGHTGLKPPQPGVPFGWRRPTATRDNDYEINYEVQKKVLFSGIECLGMQDQAMQESMGPIYDRTQEHLGSSDTAIIQVRRRWLKAAADMLDHGITPLGVNNPDAYYVRAAGVVLPRSTSWVEGARDHLMAREGVLLASA
ncbi:MAG TPA: Rieske 2Fe-2S domain-containing protein [Chloroflexota bacterium]|jgi:phenylpropionate dioxygenase-like ring-hydroxylating dioxygenase large terminal subunit